MKRGRMAGVIAMEENNRIVHDAALDRGFVGQRVMGRARR